MELKSLIQDNSHVTVNNGKSKSFGDESWCTQIPLKDEYPQLWKLSRAKEVTINQSVSWANSTSAWNLNFKRRLNDSEVQQVTQMLEDIGSQN